MPPISRIDSKLPDAGTTIFTVMSKMAADHGASDEERALAAELILEGLHLSKRLNKDAAGPSATYRGRT